MDFNPESILDALNDFEKKPSEIPQILEEYLERIAKNGEILFPWCKLKPLLKRKLELVLDEFYESCPVEISVPVPNFETFNFDNLKKTILQAVDAFASAPFTIQRICELVTNPKKHYNRTDKYMRGIEKNVLVVSTIEPRIGLQGDGNNNANPVVNGLLSETLRDDNDTFNGHENNDSVTSANLNTPANHVLLENFANVFPTAACIPSASNICINRELDNNFVSNSECVETPDVSFESSLQSSEATESMDTKSDEVESSNGDQDYSENNNTDSDNESVQSSDKSSELSSSEEKESLKDENTQEPEANINEVTASEDVKIEADCSNSTISDSYNLPKDDKKIDEGAQDNTISQSDDTLSEINISQSEADNVNSEVITEKDIDSASSKAMEVSQSENNNDAIDQAMEVEPPAAEETS